MNPVRCVVFLQQFTKMGITAIAYGGYPDAERKMTGFAPPYGSEDFLEESFPVVPLAITYNGRFSRPLTHRDFLGSVLGLGLDRGKVGDIRIGSDGAVMYVAEDIAGFVSENLSEVGRTTVTAAPHVELPGLETPGRIKRITAASLRLDAVISEAFHLSRGKAAALIEAEKVFVNWVIGKKTRLLGAGDMVTIRQVGRLRLDEIAGTTKKDRVAIVITIF